MIAGMKQCGHCKRELPLEQFNLRYGKPQSWCKECNSERSRRYYLENRQKHKSAIRQQYLHNRSAVQEFIVDYLRTHGCADCGESDPVVLEFDHVSGSKAYNISTMIAGGWSVDAVKRELAKCEVVCANCHRRRTARQYGWYKTLLP